MSNEKRLQQIRDAARYKYPDERIHFIDGAKWADSHPQWIPVEEELPKENERIIAYNGVFNEIHLCDFHDGIFEDFYGPFTDGKITHWMPIVPPRKEDKE